MNRKHRLVSKVVIKNGQDSGISDYDYVEMKSNLLGVFLLVLCILGQCTDCRVLLQFKENDPKRILGTVDVEDCGSLGNVFEVRVDGCDQTPCQLEPGSSYVIEVDFSTSTAGDFWNVIVTGINIAGNVSVVVLNETVEASILPGERHTLQYELPVSSMFEGLDIKVKVELIEDRNRVQEVCIAADAHVNEVPTTTSASSMLLPDSEFILKSSVRDLIVH